MTTNLIRSLFSDLENIRSVQPDKVALLGTNGQSLTYDVLLNQIEHAHAWLISLGMSKGDTLIALMPNAIETVILFLASLRGGYIYAPLPCTATVAEIIRWKKLTHARFCFFADPVNHSLQEKIIEMEWLATNIKLNEKTSFPHNFGKASVVGEGRIVMASSGSTGEPKAMLIDAERLWSAGHAFLRFHQIKDSEIRFWNYLPMSYLGGLFNLTLIPLATGGSIYISDAFNGKTFLTFWANVERFKINSLWLVPTIMRGLTMLAGCTSNIAPYPKIKHCYLGTAPASLAEKQKFYEIFAVYPLENYGLSETTFISSELLEGVESKIQGSVGVTMPDVEIKLIPVEQNEEVTAFEICVKTPYMMLGYFDVDGMLCDVLDQDDFLHTGDCGELIDGQIILTGRHRDVIKKGGVLIALREVEVVAQTFPKVTEAVAVKVTHDFYGESYVLYFSSDKALEDINKFISELTIWLHEQFDRHKWPEKIVYCHDFPRTSSGKIQKHRLSMGEYSVC